MLEKLKNILLYTLVAVGFISCIIITYGLFYWIIYELGTIFNFVATPFMVLIVFIIVLALFILYLVIDESERKNGF